jgi:hypothetical protein
MKAQYYLFVFFSAMMLCTVAGEVRAQFKQSIQVHARAHPKEIIIRLAPSSAAEWERNNKFGYILERYTVLRDGRIVANKEKRTIELKVFPFDQWARLADRNKFAAIAGEAIFNENLDVINSFDNEVVKAYQRTKQVDLRYGFAMFCADMSAEVATASGLFYRDTLVKANERYLYRVYSQAPSLPKDTALAYHGTSDYFPLPEITNIKAEFGDHAVAISWNSKDLREYYSAYWIEKSKDGKVFEKANDLPFINFSTDDSRDPDQCIWTDSLEENGKAYYFRVRGISPFAEEGPASIVLQGVGAEPVVYSPRVVGAAGTSKNEAIVRWKFPDEYQRQIKGFDVERSRDSERSYRKISNRLPASARDFIDPQPLDANYYRIVAITLDDRELRSFPMLYQPLDSVPPLAPTGLTGTIDSLGRVYLTWKKNEEPDLLGYRVLRSNFRRAEFSQITSDPVLEPGFVDTISLNNLTSSIYYKVQAVDTRYNPSSYSVVAKLRKPDIIAPVSPVLKSLVINDNNVQTEWIKSSSTDVHHYELQIRDTVERKWRPSITVKNESVLNHTYENLPPSIYSFRVLAIDSSGNRSSSLNAYAQIKQSSMRPPLNKIKASTDYKENVIQISWEYKEEGLKKILVYRATESEPMAMYGSVQANENIFVDKRARQGVVYTYLLRAEFNDGSMSPYSDKIDVKF